MSRPGRFVSPRNRLLAAFIAVTLVMLGVSGVVTFIAQTDRVMSGIDVRLSDQVDAIHAFTKSDSVKVIPPGGVRPSVREPSFGSVDAFLFAVIGQRPPGTNDTSLAIVNGAATYQPGITGSFNLATDAAFISRVVSDVASHEDAVFGTHETAGGTARYIAIPVTIDDEPATGIYVYAINVTSELAATRIGVTAFVITSLLGVILLALIGWFAITQFQRRSRSHAPEPAPAPAAAPPPAIDQAVVDMMDRVEGSIQAQRQLLDDIRHELKTPITIVRGYLEMMDAADPTDVQQAREIGISELDRMTRLVEDIDALATVEGDEYTMGTIDIARLTMRVAELVSIIPSHQWQVTQVANGIIRGNTDRLLQAWLALSDNAMKYTPAGSVVEIGSRQTLDAMMLWVRDHGPGIPAAARHRIFRRFDRGAGKREVGGSGLGLAIVDAIARAHGGSCSVTETPGGGATFTIHLPLRLSGTASTLPAPVRAGDAVGQWEQQQ